MTKEEQSKEAVDQLRAIYVDFDRAFNRTRSRGAVDCGLLLVAIHDRLAEVAELLRARGTGTGPAKR